MKRHSSVLLACTLSLSGCATSAPPETAASPPAEGPSAPPATVAAPSTPTAAPKTREEAHRLAVATVACWLGGLWSDADGVADLTERAAASDKRCHELVKRVYGSDDPVHYERLRAMEPVEVSEVVARVQSVAHTDEVDAPRERQLGVMLTGVADAEREMTLARRAGDKVKFDVNAEQAPAKLTVDERAAIAPLSDGKAFDALLGLDAGDLTHEARAVAVLIAEDRMKTASGLPKHLKVFAVQQPYVSLFRVPAPEVSADATPLEGGAWLTYLTTVAKAAGHAVPAKAGSRRDQEQAAWCGTLQGLADKLRAESDQVSDTTDLKRILGAVVRRIESECHASEAPGVKATEAASPAKGAARAKTKP